MEEELKPCPLCGKEAKIFQAPSFGSDNPTEYCSVRCTNEDCLMSCGIDALYELDERKDLEIAWNKRTVNRCTCSRCTGGIDIESYYKE